MSLKGQIKKERKEPGQAGYHTLLNHHISVMTEFHGPNAWNYADTYRENKGKTTF